MQSVGTATSYIQSMLVFTCALGPPHTLQEFNQALSKTPVLWQKHNLGAPLSKMYVVSLSWKGSIPTSSSWDGQWCA